MSFLSRYRELRGEDAPDEVEYNFGRAFHHLGARDKHVAEPVNSQTGQGCYLSRSSTTSERSSKLKLNCDLILTYASYTFL